MDFNSSEVAIGWLRKAHLDGDLEIKPPYQRNPVWAARQKCSLIESILLKLPVPEIFIQKATTPEGRITYGLVDGQQRVRTVLQFLGAETNSQEEDANAFILDKLDPQSPWHGKAFLDLDDQDKRRFYSYNFSVRYLNTDSEFEVRDMFKRLNKFLTPLNAQEIRNAVYTGPFILLSTKLADDEYWALNAIIRPSSIRRMGDIEFMSELLIGLMHGPQGGSSKVVDEYYELLEDYEGEFPEQGRVTKLFATTLEAVQLIYPSIQGTRWANKADFYTLFVALGALLREHSLPKKNARPVRSQLDKLAAAIDKRLANEDAKVSSRAVAYVRAVEKGVNDKLRRARRHEVLTQTIAQYFKPRPKPK